MTEATLTIHGEERLGERSGKPKRALQKLADNALERGYKRTNFSGSFGRYLDAQYLAHRTANNIRVYSGQVFIFNNETLITAWAIPPKFKNVKAK